MIDKIAFISVVYNNYLILNDFFKSLDNQNNKNFKLFLNDTSEKKQQIKKQVFPLVVVNIKNLGYAHGVNEGIKNAVKEGYDKFCIINNDTFFDKDFVNNCLQTLEKNPNSLVGGKIYYAPNYEYHNKYSTKDLGQVIWYAGGKNDWKNCLTRHIGVDEIDKGQYSQFQRTDFITGCLMLYDKKVLETVGLWNENYFLYFEDADYCERAKKKNIPVFYDPSVVIWHKNGQSTEGPGSKLHQKYQKQNQLKFGLKYAPFKTKLHLIKNYIFG